jgi:hypothetical protein
MTDNRRPTEVGRFFVFVIPKKEESQQLLSIGMTMIVAKKKTSTIIRAFIAKCYF